MARDLARLLREAVPGAPDPLVGVVVARALGVLGDVAQDYPWPDEGEAILPELRELPLPRGVKTTTQVAHWIMEDDGAQATPIDDLARATAAVLDVHKKHAHNWCT